MLEDMHGEADKTEKKKARDFCEGGVDMLRQSGSEVCAVMRRRVI